MNTPQQSTPPPGPMFESGPGWGQRLRMTLGGSLWLPVVSVLVFIIGLGMFINSRNTSAVRTGKPTSSTTPMISVINETGVEITIISGDSYTTIARRAITTYINNNPESSKMITPGMRIYAEEQLKKELSRMPLTVGTTFSIKIGDIKAALTKATALTPAQLKKWEFYGNRIKF